MIAAFIYGVVFFACITPGIFKAEWGPFLGFLSLHGIAIGLLLVAGIINKYMNTALTLLFVWVVYTQAIVPNTAIGNEYDTITNWVFVGAFFLYASIAYLISVFNEETEVKKPAKEDVVPNKEDEEFEKLFYTDTKAYWAEYDKRRGWNA